MLTYSFAERGELSLYEYLYRCIRTDIETGAIAANEKLPSKRSLARHLGVSLITVEGAYAQLLAEGYVRSEPRRGYYACAVDIESVGQDNARALPDSDPELSFGRSGREASAKEQLLADFTGGSVPLGLFPYGSWAKSVRDALSCESEQALIGETDAAGSWKLRHAIATHLRGFRGMEVDPENIVIGAGSQMLYNVLVQLLGRNLIYGVEDPGYLRLSSIYRANDVSLVHVPLDERGVSMETLQQGRVDVLHFMPSHQYPTGLVTSIGRRYELLGWATSEPNRYLIEDDYDCEFRLAGKPIPSLQSIDAAGRVIYANTFTKSLGPAFRIGYVVLPDDLAQRFREQLGFYSCTVSAVDQLALARFIESGDYERHVNRMRTHYRNVRDALLEALQAEFIQDQIFIEAADAGIHFVLGIGMGGSVSDKQLADFQPEQGVGIQGGLAWDAAFETAALERGVRVRALSDFCQIEAHQPCDDVRRFVVSYGGLNPANTKAAAQALAQAAAVADAGMQTTR